MSSPILNTPGPSQHKLEMVRQHYAPAVAELLAYSEEKQRLRG